MQTLAGNSVGATVNGIGTTASINNPWGLCIDSMRNLYVSSDQENTIRRISSAGLMDVYG